MTDLKMQAMGEHIILVSEPIQAGDEEFSQGGIVLGVAQQGGMPDKCTVYSIGSKVPEGYIEIGDETAVPLGSIKAVVHPDVASGKKTQREVKQKYVTCHYTAIACVYKPV